MLWHGGYLLKRNVMSLEIILKNKKVYYEYYIKCIINS